MASRIITLTFLILLSLHSTTTQARSVAISNIFPSCQYGNCPTYSYNNCSLEIEPAIAVIHAGIMIEKTAPGKAREKLDAAIKRLKNYISDIKGAKLQRLGTIRATNGSVRNSNLLQQQYVLGEQLMIHLSPETNIDEIIEQISQKGVNRFGVDWITGHNYSGIRPLVLYTTNNLYEDLNKKSEECKAEAWKLWCQTRAGNHVAYCTLPIEKVLPHLNITNFYVNGSQVFENNNYTNFNMNFPWDKNRLKNIYFRTDNSQSLRGNMNIQLVPFLIGSE